MMTRYVIIGCGVAAVNAVEAIRSRDRDGVITIFNGEPFPFYYRAAMSFHVSGAIDELELFGRPESWSKEFNVRIINVAVTSIDTDSCEVMTANEYCEPYDKLLIATGAKPFMAPWDGVDLPGIMTYRTLSCVNRTVTYVKKHKSKKSVVIGGGIWGVELADNFKKLGLDVTMLVREPRILELLFDRRASQIIELQMEGDGINILTETELEKFEGDNSGVKRIPLQNGSTLEVDIVGAAIGIVAIGDFLEGSKIAFNRGVIVNENLETNIKNVWSAGDGAVIKRGDNYSPCRTWLTAANMGKLVGENMTGAALPFVEKVFFNASHAYKSLYAVVGDFNAPEDETTVHHLLSDDGENYQKVIVRGQNIVGAQFLGSIRSAWQVKGAMENDMKVDVDKLKVDWPGGFISGLPQMSHAVF